MKYREMYDMAVKRLKAELFDLEGFTESKGGLGGGISFIKKIDNHRVLGFGCSIAKYGDWQVLGGMSGKINFLEIESIIIPILIKYELMGKVKINDVRTVQVHYDSMGLEELKIWPKHEGIQIHNKVDVDFVVEAMKTNYLTYTKIGFEKFTNIQQFIHLIEGKDVVQMSNVLGQFGLLKRAIIYRLCNKPEYVEELSEKILLFEKVISEGNYDVNIPKWYNTAIELKEILDKTPPIYNL